MRKFTTTTRIVIVIDHYTINGSSIKMGKLIFFQDDLICKSAINPFNRSRIHSKNSVPCVESIKLLQHLFLFFAIPGVESKYDFNQVCNRKTIYIDEESLEKTYIKIT